jgi:N-acetylglucosaminyldiphosphoundecaprenol N-acetyl-beta-D-mannosaminyltransferase
MTTLAYPRQRDCVNSLGIPVDNLSLRQAIDRIINMAKNRDGNTNLVSTLNVDFLVNSLGWAFTRPRHPELLNVLRNSALVTADGFPILWLSKIAGTPLRQRVTGSDMTPELARRAARENLSLFLLGGGEGAAAAAAKSLQANNPGLKIAGTSAPFIHTQGPGLADCAADDREVLHNINNSGADILLVGLGNPKQELWFNRNRHKLRVPVAIGIGGTFEFITGTVKRAPVWMQKMNLEWAYRISQDPGRLWSRYTKGLLKLSVLTAPLLYYRAKEELLYRGSRKADAPAIEWSSVWSSRDLSLAILRLPRLLTRCYLEQLVSFMQEPSCTTVTRLLDFSQVKHVEISGHQEFFALSAMLRDPGNDISLLGMTASVKRQLAACRIMDILGENQEGNPLNALNSKPANPGDQTFSCKSYMMGNTGLIFLAGRLDGESLARTGFVESLRDSARDRTCILDFRDVFLLESSAIAELYPLITSVQASEHGEILISGAGPNIRQMFRMSALEEPVRFIEDTNLLDRLGTGEKAND